jgi:hypothetical protein
MFEKYNGLVGEIQVVDLAVAPKKIRVESGKSELMLSAWNFAING